MIAKSCDHGLHLVLVATSTSTLHLFVDIKCTGIVGHHEIVLQLRNGRILPPWIALRHNGHSGFSLTQS